MSPMFRDGMYHAVTVAELADALTDYGLQEADLLVPNEVKNLAIVRDGRYLGYVDFGQECEVTWNADDD